tara:strand:+ start:372 stop:629 length:258 start_codon:yes stop_codon:yes gene_type:complete
MIAESKKEKIRNEYVHGFIIKGERVMPTLDYLIEKHGMASSTIYRMSSEDNWKQQKKDFSDRLKKEIDTLQINRMKNLLGEVNDS